MEKYSQSFDVCIVCALPEEARALLEVVRAQREDPIEEHRSPRYHYSYRLATVKNEQVEPLFQRALAICVRTLGWQHPHTVTVLENYVVFLQKMGREKEAERVMAWFQHTTLPSSDDAEMGNGQKRPSPP